MGVGDKSKQKKIAFFTMLYQNKKMPYKIQNQEKLILLIKVLKCCKKPNFNF